MAEPRALVDNLVQLATTFITSSSQDPAFGVGRLRDETRSATWRSLFGWNIVLDFNNKLHFLEGANDLVATIASGNYSTAAALATAVASAMNAVAIANTYTCTYANNKFTIARATGAATISLIFNSGATEFWRSIHLDLGFTSSDKTGQTTYTGTNVAYHSREFIKIDCGSAKSLTVGAVLNHNMGASGSIRQQGDTTELFDTPDVDYELTGDDTIRIAYVVSGSKRFWRIVVDDVQNTAGYSEVGIWYAGTYRQPTVAYTNRFPKRQGALSSVDFAANGAKRQTRRATLRQWGLEWLGVSNADRLVLEGIESAAPKGTSFLFSFDAVGDVLGTRYVFLDSDIEVEPVPPISWAVRLHLTESLG